MAIEKNKMSKRMQAALADDIQTLPDVDEDVLELSLSKIALDPDQPRKDVGDISGLSASIKEHGVLNPIIVRPATAGRYMVVAGERRYRAATKAGRKVVLCIIRTLDEQQTAEIQLVENLHRKDLNPFEEADGYARLKTNHNYTDAQISKKVSKARSTITEMLGITRIPEAIRAECRRADIPLSKDTLYLMARQKTAAEMRAVLEDALSGAPREARREKARTGKTREATASKKPKWTHTVDAAKATVIIQSHNSTLSKQREIKALEEALKSRKRAK